MVEAHNLFVELADGTMLKVDRMQQGDVLHVKVDSLRHFRDVQSRFPEQLQENVVVTLQGAGENVSIEPRDKFIAKSTAEALAHTVHEQHAEIESLRRMLENQQGEELALNEQLESALLLVEELKATPPPAPAPVAVAPEPTTLEERAAQRREETAPPARQYFPPAPPSIQEIAREVAIPPELLADNTFNSRPSPPPPRPLGVEIPQELQDDFMIDPGIVDRLARERVKTPVAESPVPPPASTPPRPSRPTAPAPPRPT